jgi:hypothetical protein
VLDAYDFAEHGHLEFVTQLAYVVNRSIHVLATQGEDRAQAETGSD